MPDTSRHEGQDHRRGTCLVVVNHIGSFHHACRVRLLFAGVQVAIKLRIGRNG
jgi:hypothetical protein